MAESQGNPLSGLGYNDNPVKIIFYTLVLDISRDWKDGKLENFMNGVDALSALLVNHRDEDYENAVAPLMRQYSESKAVSLKWEAVKGIYEQVLRLSARKTDFMPAERRTEIITDVEEDFKNARKQLASVAAGAGAGTAPAA